MTTIEILLLISSMLGGLALFLSGMSTMSDSLARISSAEPAEEDRAIISLLSAGNTAFGRMGKVAERVLGIGKELVGYRDQFTEADRSDIRIVGDAIYEVLQLTIRGFTVRNPNLSLAIRHYTEEVTALSDIVKRRFMQRFHEDGRQRSGSTLYTDICYAEDQLIDYCDMVADALIRYGKERPDLASGDPGTGEETRKQVHELFRDKFEMLEKQSP